MCKLLCVTNRHICPENILRRIERLVACDIQGIILREKDLPENEYEALARDALKLCQRQGVPLILHSFFDVAARLDISCVHFPMPVLSALEKNQRKLIRYKGASCHSLKDAQKAKMLGCSYITAGHIFDTECKAGIPGRGTDFLKQICAAADIPVYAIGGITPDNIKSVIDAGAAGACVMKGAMVCENTEKYILSFKEFKEAL